MFVYVLHCNDAKYYVGKTEHIARRFKEHKEGNGAAWTKEHKPIGMIDLIECDADDCLEVSVTLKTMQKYGIENVRGSIWCNTDLSVADHMLIKRLLSSWYWPKAIPNNDELILEEVHDKHDKQVKQDNNKAAPSKNLEPVKVGAIWSATEHEQLLREIEEGLSLESIALKHMRSIGSIKSRIKHMQTRGHHLYTANFVYRL